MKEIATSLFHLIGNTPLLELSNYKRDFKLKSKIIAKLEYFNPLSSIKDRVGLSMIKEAEEKGLLNKNTTIIEPTSGNTGIALAFVATSKGYRLILTMPESMSVERRKLLVQLGAELELTAADKGMDGAIKKAEALNKEISNSIILQQFCNPANPEAHKKTTAKEIWEDTKGNIDFLVAGVGTGGTISGIGEFLKEKNPNIKIVAVEPKGSPVLSKGTKGSHKIQGIGAGFVPKVLNTKIYDKVIAVGDNDAIKASKSVAKKEGLLVGISSGAALFAATELALMPENSNKNIVVIFPDSAERYLSTELFD